MSKECPSCHRDFIHLWCCKSCGRNFCDCCGVGIIFDLMCPDCVGKGVWEGRGELISGPSPDDDAEPSNESAGSDDDSSGWSGGSSDIGSSAPSPSSGGGVGVAVVVVVLVLGVLWFANRSPPSNLVVQQAPAPAPLPSLDVTPDEIAHPRVVQVSGVFPEQSNSGSEDAYTDPFAYCRMKRDVGGGEGGVADDKYVGTQPPPTVAEAVQQKWGGGTGDGATWRCMEGRVYACNMGASGRACRTAATSDDQWRAIKEDCRATPKLEFIANATNYSAADWRCIEGRPVVVQSFPVDQRGYLVGNWVEVRPPSPRPVPSMEAASTPKEEEEEGSADPQPQPGYVAPPVPSNTYPPPPPGYISQPAASDVYPAPPPGYISQPAASDAYPAPPPGYITQPAPSSGYGPPRLGFERGYRPPPPGYVPPRY